MNNIDIPFQTFGKYQDKKTIGLKLKSLTEGRILATFGHGFGQKTTFGRPLIVSGELRAPHPPYSRKVIHMHLSA